MTTAEQLEEFRKSHHVQHITISGYEWSFISCGKGIDTIVLLPGIFGIGDRGAETRFPSITELESYARIVSIGYPINVTKTEDIIEGLKTILDEQEIVEATFISVDIGTQFLLLFLARYPQWVKNIILTNYLGYIYLNPTVITELVFNLFFYSLILFYKSLPENVKIKKVKKGIINNLKDNPDSSWISYLTSICEENSWKGIYNAHHFNIDLRKKKRRITPERFIGWEGRVLILNSETVQNKRKITTARARPLFKNVKLKIFKNAGTLFWITHLKETTNEVLNFLGLTDQPIAIADNINTANIPGKIINNIVPPKKSMAPYLLGILCLIPLLGAFVGFGLLLYALLYYKDKWLAIIGAFGIVFTIAVYSLVFYIGFKSGAGKKGFEMISQMQLNSLVKDIEYYKLQYGQYPDSIQQLKRVDTLAPIHDVIPFRGFNKLGKYYNYEKVGDKYLLFSSGEDDIPNTADDLYPQIKISDSSKIGWIRSK